MEGESLWRVQGFEEIRILGEGAFGRVVLARDERYGAPVAIKYLAGGSKDERAVGLLHDEAAMLARVSHPRR